MEAEVYCLTAPNGKRYVGVTCDFRRRLREHLRARSVIGQALRKYGLGSFQIIILARTATSEEALEIERREVDRLRTLSPGGYNVAKGGKGGLKGRKVSPETLRRIKTAAQGQRNGFYGKHHSRMSREKISDAGTRLWLDPEHRDKMKAHHTADFRRRKGAQQLQWWNSLTEDDRDERREHLRTLFTGRKHLDETKRKISEANKRRWAGMSDEERARISEAIRRGRQRATL